MNQILSPIYLLADDCAKLVILGYNFEKCSAKLEFPDIIKFIVYLGTQLIGLGIFVAIIYIMIGGAKIIFAGGNEQQVQQGKNTLLYAIIGFVITVTAYVIVDSILNYFLGRSLSEPGDIKYL